MSRPAAPANLNSTRNPQSATRNPQSPTFSKDVAPILQKSCQTCHHQGTPAPMSLVTYDEVRPWARSIRQRVASREMPPWHLDKTVGIRHYKNDRSLSDEEIATVVRWVDSGAPQGNPAEMPPPLTFRSEADWFIGEPDLKVTTPNDFAMYATGPDWWIDQFADVELTEDRWIKAMEIKPSNPKIVHHVVIYVIEPDAPEGTPETGVQLHEYAVGKYGDIFGENTGRLLLSWADPYDSNGHINYGPPAVAARPLPAGTILHFIATHDNTSANRRNPDPAMWVGFGERSVDDMLQVWLNIVYLDDAEFQRLVEERKAKPAATSTSSPPR